ncbi:MAG: nuclear transport factor 2 family protein [Sinimarinibacterium sp.]
MNPAALQRLADRIELKDLVVRYANAIDRRDFEALDSVFTPDAWIDYRAMGGVDGPYPAVKKWLPQALQHFPAYMHFVGNCGFTIDGDRATGRIACFNPMVVPKPEGGTDTMFLGLWYVDEYVRTADGWRITRRAEEKCYDFNMPAWMKKALNL